MPSSRRYNDQEIGALIQRATELYEASGSREDNLSLDEVEHIAKELGVPTEFVRAAAVEMATGRHEEIQKNLLGYPFVERITDIYDAEISDEQWEDILMEMRRLEGSGTVTSQGSIREWKKVIQDMNTILAGTRLTARTKGGQTTLELQKFSNGLASVAYILAAIAGFTIGGASMDGSGVATPIIFSVAASGGVGMIALTRLALGTWSKKQRSRLDWVANRVRTVLGPVTEDQLDSESPASESIVSESVESSTEPTAAEPLIELPDNESETRPEDRTFQDGRERYS